MSGETMAYRRLTRKRTNLALSTAAVLVFLIGGTGTASAVSSPRTIDLNGAALVFNPGTNVGPNSGLGFEYVYRGVATVGADRLDAKIKIVALENVAENDAESCNDANSPRVARLDRNSAPLDAIYTRLEVCPNTGFVQYSLEFFATTTTDPDDATEPVILKNLVANFTDVDNNEFIRLTDTKSFRKTEASTVTSSYEGSVLVFTGQTGDLEGSDSTTKGQVEASFIDTQSLTIRLGRTRSGTSSTVVTNDFFVDFSGADLGAGATSGDAPVTSLAADCVDPGLIVNGEASEEFPTRLFWVYPSGALEEVLFDGNAAGTGTTWGDIALSSDGTTVYGVPFNDPGSLDVLSLDSGDLSSFTLRPVSGTSLPGGWNGGTLFASDSLVLGTQSNNLAYWVDLSKPGDLNTVAYAQMSAIGGVSFATAGDFWVAGGDIYWVVVDGGGSSYIAKFAAPTGSFPSITGTPVEAVLVAELPFGVFGAGRVGNDVYFVNDDAPAKVYRIGVEAIPSSGTVGSLPSGSPLNPVELSLTPSLDSAGVGFLYGAAGTADTGEQLPSCSSGGQTNSRQSANSSDFEIAQDPSLARTGVSGLDSLLAATLLILAGLIALGWRRYRRAES